MHGVFSAILNRRGVVLAIGALTMALGAVAWFRLPIDAFPDVTNIQVMILSKAGGLSAVETEQRITYPIEQVMTGLPRVRLVRSLSRAGLSQVVVVFEDTVDPYFARQVVFERLQEARAELPAGVEPEMAPLSTGLGEIFQYTIEGDSLSLMERRSLQDWLVAPQLRGVPGVTEVNSFGGQVRQYQVLVRPQRLLEYGLRYDNPPGGRKTCLNTKLARCELTLERPGQPTRRLLAQHRAAFEILTDDDSHGIQIVA